MDFSLKIIIVTKDIREVFFVVIKLPYLRFYLAFSPSFSKGKGEYSFFF